MKKKITDNLFITVGSKKQKDLAEKLLGNIAEKYDIKVTVIPDEQDGMRIGSGGAVLNIISNHYDADKRLLIINSGGLSQRSVNYALRGKAFAKIIYKGQIMTLLEAIVANAKRLLDSISSGVIISCSDILVETEDLNVEFDNNVGFCVRSDIKTGTRHGVMFCGKDCLLSEYPHKAGFEQLNKLCDEYNQRSEVFVDTGLVFFDNEFSCAIKELNTQSNIVSRLVSQNLQLNLYPDIVSLLSLKCTAEEYLSDCQLNSPLLEIKSLLYKYLSEYTLKVQVLKNRNFIHFGSLTENLENIFALANNNSDTVLIDSHVDKNTVVGKHSFIENSIINGNCEIGSGCIISDISFEGDIKIKDDTLVCAVKTCDGNYIAIVTDIHEDPKSTVGSKALWDTPRFYKGKSFTESLVKFFSGCNEEKYSMRYCLENADFDYYHTRCQYLNDMSSCTFNERYLEFREEIINNYFKNNCELEKIECKKDFVEVSLPVRVNFSGTWTDAMPYCVDNGGQVVNMAITVDGKKPIYVSVEKLEANRIEFVSDGIETSFSFDDYDSGEDLSDFILHIAALKTVGMTKDTLVTDGFRLTTKVSGIDKGSGLGTSSILLAGCIKALGIMFGFEYNDNKILQMVFVAEQIMKTGGGWQDQVGGLFPSIKVSTSVSGLEQELSVKYIDLPKSFEELFNKSLVLMPTGQRHFGRFIVSDVVNRYICKNPESLYAHKAIRQLNEALIKSIAEENYADFSKAINRHRELLKKISPMVTNAAIDSMIDTCMLLADAISPCGAGGGGYLLVVLKENVSVDEFKTFVAEKFPSVKSPVRKIDIYC